LKLSGTSNLTLRKNFYQQKLNKSKTHKDDLICAYAVTAISKKKKKKLTSVAADMESTKPLMIASGASWTDFSKSSIASFVAPTASSIASCVFSAYKQEKQSRNYKTNAKQQLLEI